MLVPGGATVATAIQPGPAEAAKVGSEVANVGSEAASR
jgi:hypothetical protein